MSSFPSHKARKLWTPAEDACLLDCLPNMDSIEGREILRICGDGARGPYGVGVQVALLPDQSAGGEGEGAGEEAEGGRGGPEAEGGGGGSASASAK